MRGVFDEREDERAAPRRDTELTLGSFTLLAIFFGLVLLCGLFFGLGYTLGHRGSETASAATPAASVPAALQVDSARSKPSAAPQSGLAPQSTGSDAEPTAAQGTTPDENQTSETPAPVSALPSRQPVVQPALPTTANPSQNGTPLASATVQPALASSVSLMVQIAAVSHAEDADVLVAALRKRGYVVTTHRDAGDGLIHVRLGPFSSRDEANRWRLKLLNDGYNAIVQ